MAEPTYIPPRTIRVRRPSPAPSPLQAAPPPPSGVEGAPALTSPAPAAPPPVQAANRLRLSDGTMVDPEYTTLARDVSSETLLGLSTGVSGEGEGAEAGTRGVDVVKTTDKVVAARLPTLLQGLQQQYPEGVPEEVVATTRAEEYRKAKADITARLAKGVAKYDIDKPEVNQVYNAQRGVTFGPTDVLIDTDPGEVHRAIEDWALGGDSDTMWDWVPEDVRGFLAPFASAVAGHDIAVTTPGGVKAYNEKLTNWGGLNWLGNMSVLTMASQLYGTEGRADWGGPEHLENIRRGEDMFMLWDRLESKADAPEAGPVQWGLGNIAKFTSMGVGQALGLADKYMELTTLGLVGVPLLDSDSPEAVEKAGDMVTAFGLALIDPDVVGTVTVGLGSKGVRRGAEKVDETWRALRYGYKQQVFEQGANEFVAKLSSDVVTPQEFRELEEEFVTRVTDLLGPGMATQLEQHARNLVGMNTAVSTLVTTSRRRALAAAEARTTVRQQAEADMRAAASAVPLDAATIKAAQKDLVEQVKTLTAEQQAARRARDDAQRALGKARVAASKAGEEGAAAAAPALTKLEEDLAAAEKVLGEKREALAAALEEKSKLRWAETYNKASTGDTVTVDEGKLAALRKEAEDAYAGAVDEATLALEAAQVQAKVNYEAALASKTKGAKKAYNAELAAAKKAHAEALAAAEATKTKAMGDAVAEATSKVYPRQEAMDFTVAAAEHIAEEALAADLDAVLRSVRLFRQMGDRTEGAADDVAKTFDEALQGFLAATRAGSPEALAQASHRLSEAAAMAGRHSSDYVERKLAEALEAQREVAEKAGAKVVEAAGKAAATGGTSMSRRLRSHNTAVKVLHKTARNTAGHRGAQGFAVALQEIAGAYKALAEHTEAGLTPAQAAVVANVRRMERDSSGAGMRTFLHGGLKQAYSGLAAATRDGGVAGFTDVAMRYMDHALLGVRQYMDPGVSAFATDSGKVQQTVKAAEQFLFHEVEDIVKHTADFLDARVAEAKKAGTPVTEELRKTWRGQAIVDWLDGAPSTGGWFKQTMEATPWEMASPILRAVAKPTASIFAANASETERLFSGLVRSFMVTGKGSNDAKAQMALATHAASLLTTPTKMDDGTERFITFGEFAASMTAKAHSLMELPPGEGAGVRDLALAARAVIQGAALNKLSGDTLSLAVDLPSRTVEALAAIGKNDATGAEEMFTVASVLADRLGLPTKIKQLTADSGKTLQEGLALLEDPANMERFFMPRRWLQRMEQVSGEIVKTADMFAAAHPEDLARRGAAAYSFLTKWWNAGLLSGVLLPSPRYFTGNILGNISQVFIEMGAAQGLTSAIQAPLDLLDGGVRSLPFVGEKLHARVVAPLALQVDKVLPSALGSMYSPSVTRFFDADLGAHGARIGKSEWTWGQMRKEAINQGVLTSSARAMGLATLASRTEDAAFVRAVGTWTNAWGEMADAIEQRQRVSMFMNLVVNKGMSPEAAGVKVREALYDWAHPLAAWEQQHVQRLFMFWGWQRRAFGQAFRTALSPFSEAHKGKVYSPLSRTARLAKGIQGVQEMSAQYGQDEYGDKWSNVYPYWLSETGSRVALGNTLLPEEVRKHANKRGKAYTHATYTMPAPTQVETVGFLWSALGTAAAMAAGRPHDALDQGSRQLGEMLGPSGEIVMTQMREVAGFEKPFYAEDTTVMGPFDQKMLALLGGTWNEGEAVKTTRGNMEFYRRALTPLSVNLAGLLNPIMSESEIARGMGHVLRQQTGILREHPYSPAQTVATDLDETSKELKRRALENYRARQTREP